LATGPIRISGSQLQLAGRSYPAERFLPFFKQKKPTIPMGFDKSPCGINFKLYSDLTCNTLSDFFVEDKPVRYLIFVSAAVLVGLIFFNAVTSEDWRTASRESAGIAPDPLTTKEAVLHIYGANAWGWRGWFAIHTWIAAKRTGETAYTVYDVVGWRGRSGQPVMRIYKDVPDRYWYGEKPRVLKARMGKGVDELIHAVNKAAKAYPWKKTYKAFPGPNSNTFTAWIVKQVPELELNLPFSAIGSGYLDKGL